MKCHAPWIVSIVFIAAMGAAQAAGTEQATTPKAAGAVSHQAQAVTATRSAAVVQAPAALDAADNAVSPPAYALVLIGLGLLGLVAKRRTATPAFRAE